MARRAFTLIEVIIAVAVLAILSAIIVPRMTRTVNAEHDSAVSRLVDLLSMYAFRDATSPQQIALWQDPDTQWITLLVADRDPTASSGDGDHAKFEWVADPRVVPVELPSGMELADLSIDGLDVSGTDWMIATVPGGGRPTIEMHLVSDVIDTVVRLDSNSVTPIRIDSGNSTIRVRESQNLDEYGSRSEQW